MKCLAQSLTRAEGPCSPRCAPFFCLALRVVGVSSRQKHYRESSPPKSGRELEEHGKGQSLRYSSCGFHSRDMHFELRAGPHAGPSLTQQKDFGRRHLLNTCVSVFFFFWSGGHASGSYRPRFHGQLASWQRFGPSARLHAFIRTGRTKSGRWQDTYEKSVFFQTPPYRMLRAPLGF